MWEGKTLLKQLLYGGAYGTVAGFIALGFVSLPFMKKASQTFFRIIGPMKLGVKDILFISACAGIGEEVLFRATIQPSLGLWLTSILFVALHGYLSPRNLPLTAYGILMVFLVAGLGFLFEEIGLISAIIAHTLIDVILLSFVRLKYEPKPSSA